MKTQFYKAIKSHQNPIVMFPKSHGNRHEKPTGPVLRGHAIRSDGHGHLQDQRQGDGHSGDEDGEGRQQSAWRKETPGARWGHQGFTANCSGSIDVYRCI